MKSAIALAFSAIITFCIINEKKFWVFEGLLSWDSSGYFLYLPATVIYYDIGNLDFYPGITTKYELNNHEKFYGVYDEHATGHRLDKYPVGVSILELPFFLAAHVYALNTKYDADGYSLPYRSAVIFATFAWTIAGLWYLRKLLQQYYSDGIVAVVLILILFGTNLYEYTAFNYGMSHPFSFSLFSMLLYFTEKWHRLKKRGALIAIGITMGLIIIVRPVNILMAMIPLFWSAWRISKKNIADVISGLLAFACVVAIQCSYWKYISGHWVYFSYEKETFNFLSPHIWDGLMSYRKGWFIYTPLALFSIIGIIPLWRQHRRIAIVILSYVVINIYVVFSWWSWFYGGSFGCRALIETFALLALPLGALLQWIALKKKLFLDVGSAILFAAILLLNVFQTYQFNHDALLPSDNIDKAYYWHIFGKLHS